MAISIIGQAFQSFYSLITANSNLIDEYFSSSDFNSSDWFPFSLDWFPFFTTIEAFPLLSWSQHPYFTPQHSPNMLHQLQQLRLASQPDFLHVLTNLKRMQSSINLMFSLLASLLAAMITTTQIDKFYHLLPIQVVSIVLYLFY